MTKILASSLDDNRCPECKEIQRKSGFFVGIKEKGRLVSVVPPGWLLWTRDSNDEIVRWIKVAIVYPAEIVIWGGGG